MSDRVSCWYFRSCILVGSSSNADVDFKRWYFSCNGQQRALRDYEATKFYEQEPVVGFASVFLSGLLFIAVVFQFSAIDRSVGNARASGKTALSSHCGDLLALRHRVVNYHSSWVGQRQIELFDASGIRVWCKDEGLFQLLSVLGFDPNVPLGLGLFCFPVCRSGFPGYSTGRGVGPAGGAPGGVAQEAISRCFSIDDVIGDVITISRWFKSSSRKNQQIQQSQDTSWKHMFNTSWTTRRKQQQHPVVSYNEPAVAIYPVTSFSVSAYPVDMESHTQEKKKQAKCRDSTSRELQCIQSQDVVPVASKLQRYESSRSDEPAAKQLTTYEEFTNDGCQLLSSIQMAKTTRSLQKKKHASTIPCRYFTRHISNGKKLCPMGRNLNRGLYTSRAPLKKVDKKRRVDWKRKLSADVLALMTSSVTSSQSADGLSPAVARISSWTTRRKQQQHPVVSYNEPAVAIYPVASFSVSAYPVDMESHTQEKKKQAKCRDSTSRELQCIQSQDVVPVASKLQRYESSRSDEPAAKQLTTYEEFTKDGCQLLSSIQMAKTTRSLQKKRTQVLFPVGTLQDTFQTGRNLNRGLYTSRAPLKKVDKKRRVDWKRLVSLRGCRRKQVNCTVHQQREK
ncbi:protein ASPARTIC PROTEASE IN GUARD cell 1-like [Dorcoceras hygrometricum]|uniref:Protein ASPARTIC PROTEASE IN GUARD cell 1-like n=1 Tax=Dorcoceras hygrometricum TaxID=472368 RepID=A0A2Z7AQA4_9LAMI|nr:protein ASPARTIC PROTEASE IN GUARD cell 1-like [Dorcoceras hygrometricum]